MVIFPEIYRRVCVCVCFTYSPVDVLLLISIRTGQTAMTAMYLDCWDYNLIFQPVSALPACF